MVTHKLGFHPNIFYTSMVIMKPYQIAIKLSIPLIISFKIIHIFHRCLLEPAIFHERNCVSLFSSVGEIHWAQTTSIVLKTLFAYYNLKQNWVTWCFFISLGNIFVKENAAIFWITVNELAKASPAKKRERAMGTRMREYLIMTSLLIPRLPEKQAIHVQLPNWCDTCCLWRIGEDPGTESKVQGTSWCFEDGAEDGDSVYGKRSQDPFLKGPEKFSHPTAAAKSISLWLWPCFIHILLIWTEVPFV